ncbi:hypothetical protein KL936_001761 [Ogataea polymorpha]|nr:hypothetical protein KL936_001761 [Ogataea polymorpha]
MDLSRLLPDSGHLSCLFEREEVGQETYTPGQRHLIRICSISSSSTSIVCGLVAFYTLGMIHPRKRMFRHILIAILIAFDFLKAIMLLVYPAISENTSEGSVQNIKFLNAIGWLTCFSIEGADLIIVCFAVHIALLIFRPAVSQHANGEGGLHTVRKYVYTLTFLIPVILSSLTFAGHESYVDQVSWSYMEPLSAVWYLTWIIRYCIAVLIATIYVSVYFYVMRQYRAVSSKMDFVSSQKRGLVSEVLGDSVMYKVGQLLLMLVFPDVQISAKLHGKDLNTDTDIENMDNLRHHDPELADYCPPQSPQSPNPDRSRHEVGLDIQQLLHEEAMERLRIRQLQIMRQMKVIFIYPVSYILLWLWPFVAQCYQLQRGRRAYYHLWVFCISSFFQAFNCTIDTLVFLFREHPWDLRASKVDPYAEHNYGWLRRKLCFFPGYQLGSATIRDANKTSTPNVEHHGSELDIHASDSRSSSIVDPKENSHNNTVSMADFLNSSVPKSSQVTANPSTRRSSKFSWRAFSHIGSLTESNHSDDHKDVHKEPDFRKGSVTSGKTTSTDDNVEMDLIYFLKEGRP